VRGESDDDSEESDLEPEVELEPWFVPENYKVCLCVRVGVGGWVCVHMWACAWAVCMRASASTP
jgi:hypothetical protein